MNHHLSPTGKGLGLRVGVIGCAFGLTCAGTALAQPVVYVDAGASGANNGSSWPDAYTDLQAALDAAEASGGTIREIWVAAGTYKPSKQTDSDDPRSATFQLLRELALKGGYAGSDAADPDARDVALHETILSGDLQGDDSPEESDCCRVHHGTGCDDVACQTLVCGLYPDCCSESWNAWNGSCVQFATDLCSDPCNLDGNAYHVVIGTGTNETALLDGFTITAGRSDGNGGGMYIYAASPTMTNCTFRGNYGGGIYNYSGSPTLTHCTFSGNYGRGMYNMNGAPTLIDCTFSGNNGGGMSNSYGGPTLNNCTFFGNSANSAGGGMSDYFGGPVLNNCTFRGNFGNYYGGGMYTYGGSPMLTNCTFTGNSATLGGGVYNIDSPTLTNCTFSANSASFGGGMYISSGYPALTNCTFSGNSVGPGLNHRGGGIYIDSGSPTLTNCILWGNRERQAHGESAQIYVDTGTPNLSYCDVEGWTGALGGPENWSNDPLFVDANGPDNIFGSDDDNLRLKFNSPCVDMGYNTAVLVTTDADGEPRIVDGDGDGTATVDRGAYEFSCANDEECNDKDPCTVDVCDVSRGVCLNSPVECPVGQICRDAQCVDFCDVVDCNDHDVCTQDSCDAQAGQCVNTPDSCPEGVVFVDAKATGANDGSSWTDAYEDLQDALDAADASGGTIREIWVAYGTYKPSKRTIPDDPRSATFQLIDGVSLYGGFSTYEDSIDERDIEANETILSGDFNGDDQPDFINYGENAYHVVTGISVGNTTILDGFTITAGHAPDPGFLSSYGAGMFLENSYPAIRNCTFTRNLSERPTANTAWSGGGGAALFLYQEDTSPGPPPLTVSRSCFTDNSSAGDGGAVLFWGDYNAGSVIFSECIFERNDGLGAFTGYGGESQTFRTCTFSDNSSIRWAGAISSFDYASDLHIEQCRFEHNTGLDAGAVYSYDVLSVNINNSIFVGNSAASGYGGAIDIFSNALVELVDTEFLGNSAGYGGGAGLWGNGPTTVQRCQFVDNSASEWEGGGLYISGNFSTHVTDCTFTNNRAGSGGGLYVDGAAEVSDCTFNDNWAARLGGGVFAGSYYGNGARIERCRFAHNSAHTGGGVAALGKTDFLFDRCEFTDNFATVGGGLSVLDLYGSADLTGCLVAGNTGQAYGGGIAGGTGPLNIMNCSIAANTAGALGAGMIVGHNTTITNSILWGNIVDPEGGAWTDESAQIEGIEFAAIEYSDIQGWSGDHGGEGNFGLDPLFVDPTDDDGPWGPLEADFHLEPESPCINAGLTATIDWGLWDPPPPNLDLDGKPRVLCKFVDMGAYEFGVAGDLDCDRDVDMTDFSAWAACMAGPGAILPSPDCSVFDFDGDGDIDLVDFAQSSRVFSPGSP